MKKYFKNKKMLIKQDIMKYLFIFIITYYVLKISIHILTNTKLLYFVFKSNKVEALSSYVSENTFNNPISLLNIKRLDYTDPVFNMNVNDIRKKIYIYNSHPLESFLENDKTIYDMDFIFKDNLDKLGIDVDIESGDINNFLLLNNLDYGYSYQASRSFIEQNIINNNYDLIIDLHRDATNHDDTYIKINNLDCVKVMFVVGMLNPNYQLNYEVATNLSNLINLKYPNMSRGVMLKSGPNSNGLYNQDLAPNMILLELGGNNNTDIEVINTINLISPIIGEYLNGN